MSDQHYINITQQAKFSTLGELNSNTKHIWFVLHGYGQLSQYFIRKFSVLADHGHYVVAPEALSRFYLNGHSGRVGATWMTKEDRLKDIENYVTYLNSLYDTFSITDQQQVNVLGFSQGAATASRWLANGHIKAHQLLLWAGIFPPDLDIINARKALTKTHVYNIYGSQDPFLDEKKLEEREKIIEQLKINVENIIFNGKHDINVPTLEKFL